MDTLAEAVKTYAGTQAAADAATLHDRAGRQAGDSRETAASGRPAICSPRRARSSAPSKFYDCLQKCEQLAAAYADLPGGEGSRTRSPPTSRATRSGWRWRASR